MEHNKSLVRTTLRVAAQLKRWASFATGLRN